MLRDWSGLGVGSERPDHATAAISRIIVSYVLSLVVAVSLLVYWIVYVVQSAQTINSLASRLGGRGETHWLVLVTGCVLFGLLIVGLTFQLAQALGERNYSRKQEEFVSNITHEMKSPFAAIKLHAQTLRPYANRLFTRETDCSNDTTHA